MKSSILLLVLGIIAIVECDPTWRVELLNPKGFRIIMENAVGFKSAEIGGDTWFAPYGATKNESYMGNLQSEGDGRWVFQNLTATLNPGDKTIFVIINTRDDSDEVDFESTVIAEYVVPDDATRVDV